MGDLRGRGADALAGPDVANASRQVAPADWTFHCWGGVLDTVSCTAPTASSYAGNRCARIHRKRSARSALRTTGVLGGEKGALRSFSHTLSRDGVSVATLRMCCDSLAFPITLAAQSGGQRRFAPISLIDYRRMVIRIREEG